MESKNEWRGRATYFDGTSARANKVDITITRTGLTIVLDGAVRHFKAADFQVTERLENYIRLHLERQGGVLVLTGREAITALENNRLIKTSWFKKLPLKTRYLSTIAVLALLLLFFFTVGLDMIVERSVKLITPEWEEELGEHVFDNLTAFQETNTDSQLVVILGKCADIVQTFDTTCAFNFKIHIVENYLINAYALPGGTIVFYRGLLNKMENQSEFLGVLAHEAGHIYQRHGLKRITRVVLLGFVVSALLGDVSGLSSAILDNSMLLLSLAYGREEELAADVYAAETLTQFGINPTGLITLFEKMEESKGDWKIPAYLSTHPVTEKRIEVLRNQIYGSKESGYLLSDDEWMYLKRKPENTDDKSVERQ